jgi:superfamily I DNA/RNA helicase/CRISPR/Cas system-associated exonuclease Cas4 (RecB family)
MVIKQLANRGSGHESWVATDPSGVHQPPLDLKPDCGLNTGGLEEATEPCSGGHEPSRPATEKEQGTQEMDETHDLNQASEPPEGPVGVGVGVEGSLGGAPASSVMDADSAAAGPRVVRPQTREFSPSDMSSRVVGVAESPLSPSPEQLRAIEHDDGPALVVAAPGSGKTLVITERYLRLLRDHHLAPEQVLVLTYNNQAAVQLRDRVRDRLEPGAAEAGSLTTYNAFAVALLSAFGWRKGWAPPHIVEDAEQDMLLMDVLRELAPPSLYDPAHPLDAVRSVREVIQRAKQERLTPARYYAHLRSASTRAQKRLKDADQALNTAQKDFDAALKREGPRDPVTGPSPEVRRTSGVFEDAKAEFEQAQLRLVRLRTEQDRQLDVARVFDRIEREHKKRGLIDHDDCVLRAIQLVKTVPECRDWVRRVRFVMVDEYQDTNRAQAELVEAVAGSCNDNILVVADDDQSIYAFRGASRANIARFRQEFPGRAEIHLAENRRSTPEIVAVSRSVIEGAPDRQPKPIVAVQPAGARPEILRAATASDEAVEIAERVSRLMSQGTAPEEIAVLVRNRKDMDPIAGVLRDAHIPYIASGGVSYFQSPDVKDTMAMLAVIVDPGNSLALLRCLALPNWRLSNQARLNLSREMTRTGRPLIALLRSMGGIDFLDDVDRAMISRVVARVDQMSVMALTETASAVFWEAVRETGYSAIAERLEDLQRQQIGANLYRLVDIIEIMGSRGEAPSFAEAERYLRVMQAAGGEAVAPLSSDAKGVRLSTIHGAKGREWDHVFVAGLTEGRLPTRLVPTALDLPATFTPEGVGGSANFLAEEQRLFYVAITRPRLTLTMTYADRYAGGFEKIETASRFLGSIPASLVDRRVISDHVLGAIKVRVLPPRMRKMPDRLSYSRLRTWGECARRYEFQHVWRLPAEPQESTRLGILVHQVLQEAFVSRMAGATIDRGALLALWRRTCDGPRGFVPADTHSPMMGKGMLGGYADSPAWQNAQPETVEKEFVVQVGGSSFGGKFDRVDRRPTGITVVDYKTGVAEQDAARLRWKLQPMLYAVAASHVYRVPTVTCEFHYLRSMVISAVTYDADLLSKARSVLERRVAGLAKAYKDGRFEARPSARRCRECGFRIICDEGLESGSGRSGPAVTERVPS